DPDPRAAGVGQADCPVGRQGVVIISISWWLRVERRAGLGPAVAILSFIPIEQGLEPGLCRVLFVPGRDRDAPIPVRRRAIIRGWGRDPFAVAVHDIFEDGWVAVLAERNEPEVA